MDDSIYNNTNVKNNNFEIFNNYKVQKHSDIAEIHALRDIMKAFRMTMECFLHKSQSK